MILYSESDGKLKYCLVCYIYIIEGKLRIFFVKCVFNVNVFVYFFLFIDNLLILFRGNSFVVKCME